MKPIAKKSRQATLNNIAVNKVRRSISKDIQSETED